MLGQLAALLKPVIEGFPQAARAYRHVRDGWRLSEEPKETPMGFRLVGNAVMERGAFEPEETELVRRILPKMDAFVNIGANIGYYCCTALALGVKAYAFEPITLNLQYLMKNIMANKFAAKAEIFPMALSNETGIAKIYGGGLGASLVKGWTGISESNVTLVPASTLDNVLGARLNGQRCFVIVDVEGAEHLMLQGASQFLNMEPKPVWLVEIWVRDHQPKGVPINPNLLGTFSTFWDSGYEAWTAASAPRKVEPDEVRAISAGGENTLGTHNFLFVQKGLHGEVVGSPRK